MVSIVRLLAACGCLLWAARLAAVDQPLLLPPLDGELHGVVTLPHSGAAGPLQWTVKSTTVKRQRFVRFALEGAGTALTARAAIDESGRGTWTLSEARVDAATWFPMLATWLGSLPPGTSAMGTVTLNGSGTLSDGVPAGTITAEWRGGALRNSAAGWALEGIEFSGPFSLGWPIEQTTSAAVFSLRVKTISTSRFGARNLAILGTLDAQRRLHVSEARIEIAGGEVTVDRCIVPLDPLQLDVTLRLSRVGLADVAALVPTLVSYAAGRVDGFVTLRWSQARGLRLGDGHLAMRRDEPVEVRLAPSPGLISSSLPPRALSYYPGLGKIETGEIPLRADQLDIALHPGGDGEGRTATIRLYGGPVDSRLRAPVELDVNVHGPLEALVQILSRGQLQFGLTP